MRKILSAILGLACVLSAATGGAQTTTVTKTYTSSASIRFGAGVTTVNVSMWGGGGGGSAGGMKEYTNSTDYILHYGAGGGGANWAGGSFTANPNSFHAFYVGTGGSAGGFDPDNNPLNGGNGTATSCEGIISYGGSGGTIVGFHAFGGARGSNSVPDPGPPYAANGGNDASSSGGSGGLSNNSPYGPSAAPTYTNSLSGAGYPAGFGYSTGVPGLRPGDGGGGGGFTSLPWPFVGFLDQRKAGGQGADGVITFYFSYPTYRLTAPPTAAKLCAPGAATITLRSSTLSTGAYTVTYNTSNPASTGNTAYMLFDGATGTGSFTTIALTGTSSISITNLASGGVCSDAVTAFNTVTAIVENTVADSWAAQTDFGGGARSGAVAFTIGTKAYVGTGLNGTTPQSDFWQFDQTSNTWTQVASFAGGARSGAVGFSVGAKGYVGTGSDGSSAKSDFWEYDPLSNQWRTRAAFGGSARSGAVAFTTSSGGYVGTGNNGSSYYSDFWFYNPQTNAWTAKASLPGAARSAATAFSMGNWGYVTCGTNGSTYYNDLWEYYPSNNTWTSRTAFPGAARSGAAGFTLGAGGYVGTGWNGTAAFTDFYSYNQQNNSWATIAAYNGAARRDAVGYSIGSKGYVGLGTSGTTALSTIREYSASGLSIITGQLAAQSYCAGSAITIPFSIGCASPAAGNAYTAYLTDSTGSLSGTYPLGTSTSVGTITATIPANVPKGAHYRVVVMGSNPFTVGTDNGTDIGIRPRQTATVVTAVDNASICRGNAVNISASTGSASGSDTTVLLGENFNSGAVNWALMNSNSYSTGGGQIYTNGQGGFYSNDNSSFYLSSSSGRFSQDVTNTTLQSPVFSTLGMTSGILSFYQCYQWGNYNNSDSVRVQISTNGGQTWNTIYLNNSSSVGDPQDSLGFQQQSISLNAYLNQPSLLLRFNYAATGGLGRWMLDNIVVKGVSQANNFSWTSAPAGFTSATQNPAAVVPPTAGTTIYTVTLSNAFGCAGTSSSVSVQVRDSSSSTTTMSICPSALPFQWNGLSFTGSGTQVAHLLNAAGCDSAAKLILIVKPASTSSSRISVCPSELPYTWNGLVFTGAGAQTAHFTNTVGCDSAATLNLTVRLTSSFTQNLTICESALPYVWNGITLSAAGSSTVHFTNAVGCDSAVTLNLLTTASVTTATATATSVCAGATISLSAAASSGATVTVLNEKFNSTHNDWTKINLSSGGLVDSAAWMLRPNNYQVFANTVGFTSNDNSQFYLTNSFAQGSGVTTNTILQSPLFSTVGLTTATLNFYHQFTHQSNFANDSIRVQISEDGSNWTNLYVNKNATVGFNSGFQQQTISLNGYLNKATLRLRFVYNGTPLPGGYTNYWWAIDNVTVSGTIAASTFSWSSVPAGFTSSLQNTLAFTPTQTATYTVAVNNGICSATRSVTVTMNTTNPASVTNLAICPSSLPYTWNGFVLSGAGTQIAHISTTGGCDSIATLNLAIQPQASSVTNLTICPSGLPFTWNGLTFTAAGTKTALFATGAACDSAATLNLTVQSSSTSSTNSLTICDNQLPYTWNGQVFTGPGSKVATLSNRFGCDSIATLYLFVSNSPASVTASATVTSLCPGATTNLSASATMTASTILDEDFNSGATGWTTQNLSTGGTPANAAWTIRPDGYTYPEQSLTFHSNDNSSFFLTNSRAQGIGTVTNTILQSPVFSTVGYSAASLTFYHHFVSNSNDSIRVLVSTDYGATWTRILLRNTSLQGSSSNFQLQTVSLNAYVNQPALRLRFEYGANYDNYWSLDNVKVTGTTTPLTYSWSAVPGAFTSALQNPAAVAPTQTTTYSVAAVNAVGCRNSASVGITVKPTSSSTTSLAVCPTALPYTWNGLTFQTAGSQTAHLTNSVGCDSAATLVLTVKAPTTSTSTTSVCPGSLPYTWNGLLFNAAGSQTVHLTNAAGCDSAATYTVTVKAASSSTQTIAVCASELPYSWNGLTFAGAGSQTAQLLNSVGCDSAATLTLTVTTSPSNLTVAASATTICQGTAISLSASSLSGTTALILNEGFNGATNNWTRTNTSTGGSTAAAAWLLTASSSDFMQSNDNSQFYLSNSDAQGSGNTHTTLVSPAFSTVGLSSATLSFYHMYRHFDRSEIRVEVSTNAVNWTTLYLNNSTNIGDLRQFVPQSISLDNYLNQPNLRVRFNFNAAWGYYWAVDNVTVSAPASNTYSWTSSPAGFTSTLQNPTGVTPAQTTRYTVTATNPLGCTTTNSVLVNVTAAPAATIAYPFNNCVLGGTASVLQTGTTGGTYSAPAGLQLNAATGAVNLPGSTPGTYTVTYSVPALGSCPGFATTGSITIDPAFTIVASVTGNGSVSSPGSSTLCAGSGTTYSITPGSCASITDVLVDGVSVGAVSSYTFTDLSANHTISATFAQQAAIPTIVAGGSTTICNNSSVTLTSSAGSSYQWLRDGSPIGGATAQSFTATAAGSYTVAVISGGGCSGTSAATVLTIDQPVASISGSATVCQNSTAPQVTFSASGGTAPYTFTYNINGGAAQTVSSTGSSVSVSVPTQQDGSYTYSLTGVQSATGCLQSGSGNAVVTVSAAPSASISYGGSPYCRVGTAVPVRSGNAGGTYSSAAGLVLDPATGVITLATSTPGTYTVTYTLAATGNCALFQTTSTVTIQGSFVASIAYTGSPYCASSGSAAVTQTGSTGGTYAAPAGVVIDPVSGAIDLAASASGTYSISYTAPGGACGTSATAIVSIRPATLVDPQPNQVLCAGSLFTAVHFTGATGLTYTWTASNPAIGIAASGTGDIAAFTAQNSGTQSIESSIYVTANGGSGCSLDKPMVFRITVLPVPVVSAVANQSLCAGYATSPVNFSAAAGTLFSWTNSNPSIGLASGGTGSIGSFNAVNNTASTQLASIQVTPSANHCSGAPVSFSITVAPSAGTISYPQTSYCPKSWAYVQRTGAAGGTFSATPSGLAIEPATGAINLAVSAAGTYNIVYTTGAPAAGCSNTAGTQLTVLATSTVNPVPNMVVCNGVTTLPLAFTGATSYTWVNSNPAIGLAASGSSSSLPAFTAVNSSNVPVYATVTVTPQSAPGAPCPGRSVAFHITVNPTPTVTAIASQTGLCRGMLTSSVTFSGNAVAGSTYAWTNSDYRIGLAGRGSGNIAAFVTQNPTAATLTATVTVTPAANKCYGTPATFTYSVGNCITHTGSHSGGDGMARLAGGLEVQLSPNPVRDQLTVTLNTVPEGTWTVNLLSIDGRPMLRPQTASGSRTTIGVAAITPGAYLLRVETASGTRLTKQFVKL